MRVKSFTVYESKTRVNLRGGFTRRRKLWSMSRFKGNVHLVFSIDQYKTEPAHLIANTSGCFKTESSLPNSCAVGGVGCFKNAFLLQAIAFLLLLFIMDI